MTTITLPRHVEAWAAAEVAAGRAASVEEAVLLELSLAATFAEPQSVEADLEAAAADVQAGRVRAWDDVLAEMRARRASKPAG